MGSKFFRERGNCTMPRNLVGLISENKDGEVEYRYILNGETKIYKKRQYFQMLRDLVCIGWIPIFEQLFNIESKEYIGLICCMREEMFM